MLNSFEIFAFIISCLVIIFGIFIFNLIFSLIVRKYLKKHFPENFSELKREIGKPIKKIKLTLIRFGNEKRCYGTGYQQSIPIKLFVYENLLVFAGYGCALVINNFNHKFISFIKTESYDEFIGKKIARLREDLIIFSQVSSLQFLINKEDREYLKNFIKEMQSND